MQQKHPTWNTNSRARITNSDELSPAPHRAHRRDENSLKTEKECIFTNRYFIGAQRTRKNRLLLADDKRKTSNGNKNIFIINFHSNRRHRAHAPWNAERSVRIVALKSLRSRRARPKTTGKFYFQIKISFAQKRFVRCGV